jgi:isocitrate dehydrogenase
MRVVVLDGDETGQELLEQALRVLDPDVLGIEVEQQSFDLSLEKRRETGNEVVHEAARAMREAGYGIKAATVTPEGKDDVGSPNRILREEVGGKVIVRTGRRIPGVVGPVSGVFHPISVVRMAIEDAYGAKQWREGSEGDVDEVAYRALDVPRGGRVRVPDRRADERARLRRPEVDGLPRLRGHAQGGDGPGGLAS